MRRNNKWYYIRNTFHFYLHIWTVRIYFTNNRQFLFEPTDYNTVPFLSMSRKKKCGQKIEWWKNSTFNCLQWHSTNLKIMTVTANAYQIYTLFSCILNLYCPEAKFTHAQIHTNTNRLECVNKTVHKKTEECAIVCIKPQFNVRLVFFFGVRVVERERAKKPNELSAIRL